MTKYELEETYKTEIENLHQELIRIIERLQKVEKGRMVERPIQLGHDDEEEDLPLCEISGHFDQ